MVRLLWDVLTNQSHSMIPANKQILMAGRHTGRQTDRQIPGHTNRQTGCSQFMPVTLHSMLQMIMGKKI